MPGGYLNNADWLTQNPPTEDAWFGTVERERDRAPAATGGEQISAEMRQVTL